jgi:hypothetical protein
MPRRPSSTSASAYEHLDAVERARVLTALLDEHAPLRSDAERHSAALLLDASADEIADQVEEAIDDLTLEDLAGRAGRQPGRGYVHEVEAAYELIEEEVEPFAHDLRRRANLDMSEAAAQVAIGVLAGLYRCRDAADGSVLAYAGPDTPEELANWIQKEASRAGVVLSSTQIEAACPDWAPHR